MRPSWGRVVDVCATGVHRGRGTHMCTWAVRDRKEKVMGLVLGTLEGTERNGFSLRHRVRLLKRECQRK